MNLKEYRGIIAVSGDGLLHEIINGLMDRPDWEIAVKKPIFQLPGGSANALACCVSYLTNEIYRETDLDYFSTSMTFNLIKSTPKPLDLIKLQLSNDQTVHSFLSLEWAFIADLDLESEKFRFLGDLRFTVGAVQRILSIKNVLLIYFLLNVK